MRYRFAGPTPYYFPASRDSHGAPLGDVNPGDERDLDEPVGQWWVPVTPPGDEGGKGDSGGQGEGQDDPGESAGTPAEPGPAPGGPQPAPPAIVP
jgi:hypothetical protein